MNGKRDSLGRRKRTLPESTGKRITLKETDLLWFQKLHEHGPLPSSFLLAYAKYKGRSKKRATERLTDLFNEEETKHGGRYLSRPLQQFRTLDSRYNQLVYDLTPAGEQALMEAGFDHCHCVRPTGPWLHQCMVSTVTASIELATLERPDITYIPQHSILERVNADLRYQTTIRDTHTGKEVTTNLIPDALFGLEYHTTEGRKYRFFAVECDRATEPATTTNFNRKSWLRSLLQYREYVGRRLYREHLDLSAPLLVLNIVTEQKRLEKMVAVTEAESEGQGNTYLLFQKIDGFGPVFRPPQPIHPLLNNPWRRAGNPLFRIDTP